VKFSIRQILASTVGAVIAAVVASTFGVKGTIIGVAIGSAAATMATALVAQSIDRGHEAVKQVAVRVPDTSTLLRKLGGTGVSGPSASSVHSTAPTEVVAQPSGHDDEAAETTEMASTAAPVDDTGRLEISAGASAPATERLVASTSPMRPAVVRPGGPGRFSWRAIAVSAVTVFVLALLFITAIELISGKPLSSIFGGADTGTSLNNLVNPPAPTTTPTSPTSTTSTTPGAGSSTTTTTAGGASTSTTAPVGGQTTTSTTLGTSSTTTTSTAGAGAGTTTTTAAVP
jgi:hypothetical protein